MQIEAYLEKHSSCELPDGFKEWLKYEYIDDIDTETEIEVLLDEFEGEFVIDRYDHELNDFYFDDFCNIYSDDINEFIKPFLDTEQCIEHIKDYFQYIEIPDENNPKLLYIFRKN